MRRHSVFSEIAKAPEKSKKKIRTDGTGWTCTSDYDHSVDLSKDGGTDYSKVDIRIQKGSCVDRINARSW